MTAADGLSAIADGTTYDVIVLGTGAGGFSAAVFAALAGASVLLVERTAWLGGTTAFSAATTWVPNTRHASRVGAQDSYETALGFLDRAVGTHASRPCREAFLRAGPEVIATLEDRAGLRFRPRAFHPDYLSEIEGATSCGRALEPEPFEAAGLGPDLALIRPPIPEFTILGGMMIDRDDIANLMRIGRGVAPTLYSARLIGRHYLSKLRHGRSTRLVMGNALIGQFLAAARRLGVTILTGCETTALAADAEGVTGITLVQNGVVRGLRAAGGVVLASGGFARHPQLRARMLPAPVPEHSPAAPGHTGALHDLAFALGAHHGARAAQPCFWAPCSTRTRADGSTAVFPHFVFDRAKPGIIAVGRDGRRFVNESTSYHLFGAAQFATGNAPCYLVADATALKRYGMGMIRPGGQDPRPFLADGYLTEGATLAELAGRLGIDAAGLAETVARMNRFAETGLDTDFHRGTTTYERANGDAGHGPNPTLGKLETGPFYAVRLMPADIGAAEGLVGDTEARLLRRDGSVIGGLYACGNDLASIMGGVYPGPGITVGPAIVFGAIAARHAAARAAAHRAAA